MKKIIYTIATVILLFPVFVFAANGCPEGVEEDSICLTNPIQSTHDLREIFGLVINRGMGIVGSVALLVFIYGGFMWLVSAGNQDRIKKGTQAMMWAIIGIFIIFSSYAIIVLVLAALGAEGFR